jgi:hypothetical protein
VVPTEETSYDFPTHGLGGINRSRATFRVTRLVLSR